MYLIIFPLTLFLQIFFAGLISAVYGLVMMAVLVGVMLQISNDGFLAPSSLFFFCVAGEFIITALLHPKELNCLYYGIVYYVTVPSMYMLLVIYSVFNMNNVSWGTREVTVVERRNPVCPYFSLQILQFYFQKISTTPIEIILKKLQLETLWVHFWLKLQIQEETIKYEIILFGNFVLQSIMED